VSSDFTFDKRGMEKLAKEAVRDVAKEAQRVFDRLGSSYEGKPIAEIKPALRREWRRVLGGDITDPDLTEYAEHISAGTRIVFKT